MDYMHIVAYHERTGGALIQIHMRAFDGHLPATINPHKTILSIDKHSLTLSKHTVSHVCIDMCCI